MTQLIRVLMGLHNEVGGKKQLLTLNMWNFSVSRWGCPLESQAHSSSQQMWQEGRLGGKTLERNLGLPFRACMPGWSHQQEIYNSTSTLCRPCLQATQLWTWNLQVPTICVFVHLPVCVWVCVYEREREKEINEEKEAVRLTYLLVYYESFVFIIHL